jgi:hypothetical protein
LSFSRVPPISIKIRGGERDFQRDVMSRLLSAYKATRFERQETVGGVHRA